MFQVIANGENRLDIELNGKLNADDMKVAIDDLVRKSDKIENGMLLYKINDLDFPSLGAIGIELSRLPELFRLFKKFDRAAVLADKEWIKKISEFEGALIPGLDIKAFNLDEKMEAETWLSS